MLSPLPFGRALLEKRFHTFPKIPAHIAHENKVAVGLPVELGLQAAKPFFCSAKGKRGEPTDERRKLVKPRIEFRPAFHQLAQKPDLLRLLRLNKPRRKNHVLHTGGTDECGKAGEVSHGKAVAERAGNG